MYTKVYNNLMGIHLDPIELQQCFSIIFCKAPLTGRENVLCPPLTIHHAPLGYTHYLRNAVLEQGCQAHGLGLDLDLQALNVDLETIWNNLKPSNAFLLELDDI